MTIDPITDEEWAAAALLARGALLFAPAKLYGLVNVARCEELIGRAMARGIVVDDHHARLAFLTAHAEGDEL